jgi:hypothetical protein
MFYSRSEFLLQFGSLKNQGASDFFDSVADLRLFLMVRGMKVGSHVNLSPMQVYFFSIKTKPYRGCEKMKMSVMFRI